MALNELSDEQARNCEKFIKEGIPYAPSFKKMKKVVESAVQDDKNSRNFIIHGVPEKHDTETELAEEVIYDILQSIGSPDVIAANKIGAKKVGDGTPLAEADKSDIGV
jgi:hypothetical protein